MNQIKEPASIASQVDEINDIGDFTVSTEKGDYKVEIYQDDCQSFLEDGENLTRFLFSHRNYNLGEEGLWNELGISPDGFSGWDEIADWLLKNAGAALVKSVRLYDHSGIAISLSNDYPFNDRWDSGQLGLIYVTKAAIRKEYGVKRVTKKALAMAEKVMKNEFKLHADWVEDNVYGFTVENEAGEMIDSCGGFFGDIEPGAQILKDIAVAIEMDSRE